MNRKINYFLVTLLLFTTTTAAAAAQGNSNKSDPRSEWLSPYWFAAPNFDGSSYTQSRNTFLWVLNPGDQTVNVTVTFRKQAFVGGVETIVEEITCSKPVQPGISLAFWAPLYCDTGSTGGGSLAITADGPVLPSGSVEDTTIYKDINGQPDVRHTQSHQTMMQFYTK